MAEYGRPDYWTLRAKKEGYPARSVYKLEEIVRKFGLLRIICGERSVREGVMAERAPLERAPTILDAGGPTPGAYGRRQMKDAAFSRRYTGP